MFQAVLPAGRIHRDRDELKDRIVELYDGDDELVAVVPYPNPQAIADESVFDAEDRSIM